MTDAPKTPRVAVIDDNPMFRAMAVEWFSFAFDDRVLAFEDGRTAWDHLNAAESADIIVSDVNMPGMNGFDLLSRIKAQFPQKICILVSGNPENETTARSLGADGFMAKPFSMRTLLSTMTSLYRRSTDPPTA
jgi:DNA-binding response OmpR family regulator